MTKYPIFRESSKKATKMKVGLKRLDIEQSLIENDIEEDFATFRNSNTKEKHACHPPQTMYLLLNIKQPLYRIDIW